MSISLNQDVVGASNYPPPAAGGVSWSTDVPAGDVLVCAVIIPGTGNPGGTISVADDLANTYTALNSYYDSTNTAYVGLFYIIQPTTRSPTVTASLSGGGSIAAYGNIVLADFTGFIGTILVDAQPDNSSGGTGTAVAITPVTNTNNNTLVLCSFFSAYGWGGGGEPAGWSGIAVGSPQSTLYYSVVASASTNTPFSGTLGASAAWDGVTAAIYGTGAAYDLNAFYGTYTQSGNQAFPIFLGTTNFTMQGFGGVYNMLGAYSSSDFWMAGIKGAYTETGFPTTIPAYSLGLSSAIYGYTGFPAFFPTTLTMVGQTGLFLYQGYVAILTEAIQPAGLMMPNLVGLLYEEAQYVLAHSEILTITPPYQNYFTTPFPITLIWVKSAEAPSTVIAQSIQPGITVQINQPMTLTLSEYPVAVAIQDP